MRTFLSTLWPRSWSGAVAMGQPRLVLAAGLMVCVLIGWSTPSDAQSFVGSFVSGQSTPSTSQVCQGWNTFRGQLNSNEVYDSVTIRGSRNTQGFTCTGSVANQICQNIRTSKTTRETFTCDGRTWATGSCGGGIEVAVNQGSICSCPNNGTVGIVRPCIGNSNWGGIAGATCGGSTQTMEVICGQAGPNEAPTLQSLPNRTDDEGVSISIQPSASDPEGDSLSWSATSLPPGISINRDTGAITGELDGLASVNSPYSVTVTVSDGRNEVSVSFTWTINDTLQTFNTTYSENFTGGQSTPGTSEVCRDWNAFRGELSAGIVYDTVTVKGSRNEEGYTCTGSVANQICQNIRTSKTTNETFTCDGRTWATGSCGGGIEVLVNSSSICQCPNNGTTATVRPCIGNSNWGGVSGPTCGGSTQRLDVICGISGPNEAPVLQGLPNRTDDEAVFVSIQPSASDADDDTLTWSATNLPSGVSINESTGLISGTLSGIAGDDSPYTVTVTVNDGRSTDDASFTWTVNDTVQTSQSTYSENFTSGQSTPESSQVCRSWRTFQSELNSNTTYDRVTVKGSGNETGYSCTGSVANQICQNIRQDKSTQETFTCDGRTWTTGDCGNGVEVTVNTGGICSCPSGSNTATVRPCIGNSNWGGINGNTCGGGSQRMDVVCEQLTPNDAPVIADISDRTDDEGVPINLQPAATDANNDPLTWSAEGLPPGLQINEDTGAITGSISGEASFNSPYTVTVAVSDGRDQDSTEFRWSVNDTIRILSVNYSEDFTSGQSTPESSEVCQGWRTFQSQLGSNVVYNSVTVKGSGNEEGYTCTGSVANQICQNIRQDKSTQETFTCDGRTWTTGDCGNGVEVTVNTGGICSCPSGSNTATVRPCIGNSNWGGVNGNTCGGGSQRMDVVCRVDGENEAPTVDEIADQSHDEGDVVSLQPTARDPDGDSLTWSAEGLPSGLSINENTGLISGTLTAQAGDDSPHEVTVTVDDGRGGVNTSFTWTVADTFSVQNVNYSENFTSGQSTPESSEVCQGWRTFQDELSVDVVYDTVTVKGSGNEEGYTCTGSVANQICQNIRQDKGTRETFTCDGRTWTTGDCGNGVEVTVNTGGICSCPSGSNTATVRPCIGNSNWGGVNGNTCGGGTQRMDVTCGVQRANTAPVVTEVADQTHDEGDEVSLQIQASDVNDDTLRFSAQGLPTGLSINTTTGLISGTLSGVASEGSPYSVTVSVSDGFVSVDESFNWTVNDTIDQVQTFYSENFTSGQSTPESSEVCQGWRTFQGQLSSNIDYNRVTVRGSGNEEGYTCTGSVANQICQNIRQDKSTQETFTCDGRTWTTGDCGNGVEVTVNTGGICSCPSGSNTATVRPCIGNSNWGGVNGNTCGGGSQRMDVVCQFDGEPVNNAPTLNAIANQSHNEGVTVEVATVANDLDDDTLAYSATGLPPGVAMDSSTGRMAGTLTFAAAANSPYTVTVTVSDGEESVQRTFTWAVTDAPLNQARVLIVTPNVVGHGAPVSALLDGQEFFDVDSQTASTEGLTLSQLRQFQVVLVFTDSAPGDGGALGDVLADYVDGGGNVVEAPFAQVTGSQAIGGRWDSQGYTLVNRTSTEVNSAGTLGTRHLTHHPLLAGVEAVSVTGPRTGTTTLKSGAQRVVDYQDSQLLAGVRTDKAGRVAWVGFNPRTGYANDGLRLLVNALRWTAGAGQQSQNIAPEVTTPSGQRGPEGSSPSLTIAAFDLNSDPLSFSATGLPPGLSIDEDSGVISGTISQGAAANGPYSVTVTVGDGETTRTVSFSWQVFDDAPPTVAFTSPDERWHGTSVTSSGTIVEAGCDRDPVLQSEGGLSFVLAGQDGAWTFTVANIPAGRYAPVTVSATSGCTGLTSQAQRRFGVDVTPPLVLYTQLNQNGVDENDQGTWPVLGARDSIGLLMQARDNESGVLILTVRLVNIATNESVTLHQQVFPTSDQPPRGQTIVAVQACSNDEYCVDGALDLSTLTGDGHLIETVVNNGASLERRDVRYFRRLNLLAAVEAWRDRVAAVLSSDIVAAQSQLDRAAQFFEVAIAGVSEDQLGSTSLALQNVQSALRSAEVLDPDLDLSQQAAQRDLVGQLFISELDERVQQIRDANGDEPTLVVAESFIDRARDADEIGTLLNLLANAFFWMSDAEDPMVAENFAETEVLLSRIVDEMDHYVTYEPQLVGASLVAEARTELGEVLVLIERVVADGDRTLSDLEHLQLLLGLTNTAEFLAEAQNDAAWVRNWQWGLTQIVYIYAARGLGNATIILGGNNPIIQEGSNELEVADGFREDRRADDFMQLLIQSRCLVVAIYNFAYEPDEDPPAECCDEMRRFVELDGRFPLPDRCANTAPLLDDIIDQVGTVGDEVSLSLSAQDDDNDTLSWSATGLPDGLSINGSTGLISGTLTDGAGSPFTVTVTVTDSFESDSDTFRWVVNSAQSGVRYLSSFVQSQPTPEDSQVCQGWRTFQSELDENTAYGSITLRGSRDPEGFTCTGSVANTLCQAIRNDQVNSQRFECDGVTWSVGGCGNGVEISANVYPLSQSSEGVCRCVDGDVVTARPCIGNSNWGGANGATCSAVNQDLEVICQ